jgi:hypothetical protein
MYASATIGHSSREVRTTRRIRRGDERWTVRVKTSRRAARQAAIADSWSASRN